MSYFILEDFRLGQDSRKSNLTAAPGTLTTLINGHITRGGDIEVRKSFVDTYDLPAGTFGLAAAGGGLYVFGSAASPAGLPAGITYQRLQHPAFSAMTRVAKTNIFGGLLYVVAEFADGSTQHFYDGVLIDDFADGVARGTFSITGGSASGVAATGSFTITGGTNNPGVNKVSTITVNGVDILGAAVDWATSNSATATAVAAQIATYTSTPNYTASAVGAVVTITASLTGTTPNGLTVSGTVGGNVTIGAIANMSGGTGQNQITSVKVNGVEILNVPVSWATSNSATATAVAAQITSYSSSPEYTATAADNRVIIAAAAAGTTANGLVVLPTYTRTVDSIVNLDNGLTTTIDPGSTALTFGTKVYTVSDSRLVYSAVNDPTDYNDVSGVGAGFINMANYSAGSGSLTALGVFYDKMAIFAEEDVQIWSLFADDSSNAVSQVIQNTGTKAGGSISPFGDGDLFYLADNGIRALQRSLYSGVGTVAEVGSAIDTVVIDHIASLTDTQVSHAVSIVEPIDKRYMLAVGDKVYVYSYFAGAKIAAWSTYEVGISITDFTVLNKRVYARAGDIIYLYGGTDNATYDADTLCTVVIPYTDAKTPGNVKTLTAIDQVATGTWTVQMAVNPDAPDDYDDIGIYIDSTLHKQKNLAQGQSTYFAFKFTHQKAEAARLSRFIMYFEKDDAKSASA